MLHIGRNIFSLVLSKIMSSFVLILIYFSLLRYLGPNSAGQYGLLAGYLTIFAFLVDLGMQQLVIKKVSEDKSQAGKYFANYFVIQAVLSIGFMLIMDFIVINAHYPPLVKHSLYVTSLGLFLSSLTMPFMSIINAFQKLTVIAIVNFGNSLINASMMLLAIYFRHNIFFLAFIPVIISGLDIIIYAIIMHRKYTHFTLKFDWSFIKQLLIWNLPFMWLTFFSIYNRIDTLILPHLRGFTENGYYTAAYKVWDALAFMPAVVAAALYPYFAEKISKGEMADARKVLSIYTRYMIVIAVPIAIGAFMLADKLALFIGKDYAPAAPALWLLSAAACLLIIYVPVNTVIMSQRTKLATIITGFNLLFNLGLNILLIPKFGFVAAAVITLGSELIQLIGYTYVVQTKIVSFPYFVHFTKPLIAGLIMGIVLYFLRSFNLFFLIGLGGLVYVVAIFALGFFNRQDWELVKASVDFRKSVQPDVPPLENL